MASISGRRQNPMTLRDAVNSLFEDSFVWPTMAGWARGESGGPQAFPVDIYQTQDELVIKAQLPGVTPDALNISVLGDTVTIRGEVRPDERQGRGYLRQELPHGAYERSFSLPMPVDANAASAKLEHGILTLTLPKLEAAKPRQIRVTSAG